MRIGIIAAVCFSFFLINYQLLIITPVFAQEGIVYSRLSPENPLYFLKAVREIIEFKLAATEKVKVLRRLEFSERRLREANSLIKLNREDLIQPNMEKLLLEIKNLIGSTGDKDLQSLIGQSLGHYMQVLVSLYDSSKDPRAKLGIRSAIYRLNELNFEYYQGIKPKLAGQFFPPQEEKFAVGCNLLAKEASSSALNESEKEVLSMRGERCKETIKNVLSLPQKAQ